MIIINTDLAIKYLVEELNLKNEAELAEKLKINKKALEYITPQKNMLIQIKNKGELRNSFLFCKFDNN